MKLHLLLTNDIAQTRPETCKIILDFGQLVVRFDDETIRKGLHCVVEDTLENIVNWLKPYDSFIQGDGDPCCELFSRAYISKNVSLLIDDKQNTLRE
jgi:hypothetical protein